jgi:hypothetical protein
MNRLVVCFFLAPFVLGVFHCLSCNIYRADRLNQGVATTGVGVSNTYGFHESKESGFVSGDRQQPANMSH